MNLTPILHRWRDLLSFAVVGVAVWIAILSFWPALLLGLVQLPLAGVCATSIVLVSFLFWGASGRWVAFWGLKYPWGHPPLWCASTLGTAILLWVVTCAGLLPLDLQASARERLCVAVAMGLATLLVLTLASVVKVIASCAWLRAIRKRKTNTAPTSLSDYSSIVQWIRDDRAVEIPEHDRFGLAPVAKRTAERLARNAGSQLIVGPLGSGKTSLLHLTCWYLQRTPGGKHIHIVEVELWQYETARAAVSGIIRALIQALGSHINTVSITGVRSQYLDAMSESGGTGAVLAKALHHDSDPYDALDAIDRAASAIGLRFVVWIEDIERFLDGGISSSGQGELPSLERQTELLNPVRALVHGLDRLQQVSVVTATTTLANRFDTEKLARFIEEVPRLLVDQVTQVLAQFRKGLVDDYPEDIFPVRNSSLDVLENPSRFLGSSNQRNQDPVETLILLFITPRKLKLTLRLVYEIWEKLHGEIDRDDLILIVGLKLYSPQGFSLIRDHYAELQRLHLPADQRGEQRFSQALDKHFGLTHERQVVWAVMQAIFERSTGGPRPQGLHLARYWLRFLAEEKPSPGDRDQVVLRAVRDEDTSAIIELLVSGQDSLVQNFSYFLPDEVAFRLLVPLCQRLVKMDPPSFWVTEDQFGGHAPGLIDLWLIWRAKLQHYFRDTITRISNLVTHQLRTALRDSVGNLSIVRDLEYFYLSADEEGIPTRLAGNPETRASVSAPLREALWEALASHYTGHPERLAQAISLTPPFSLWQLVWGTPRAEKEEFSKLPFPAWPNFAATLLKAARNNPVVLAELATFLVREAGQRMSGGQVRQHFEYDRELCIRLFDSEDKVFSLPWLPLPKETRTKGCVDAVRQAVLNAAWARRDEEGWE